MNDPFLISGIITIVALIGVLLIWRRKRRRRRKMNRDDMAERPEHDLYTDRYFEDDHLLESDSIDQLDPLFDKPIMNDSVPKLNTDLMDDSLQIPEDEVISQAKNVADKENALASPKNANASAEHSSAPSPKKEEKKEERKSEMIIVLYMVAQRKTGFAGADVLRLLEELGLKYGNMSIFHHYGIGELKVQQPVFSIANMVEPGIFNPQNMHDFTTPGLALFMRLPGPFGGRVAFELMLNNAQKLAEVLEGTVEDERRKVLDQKKITALRDRIANFEQRSPNLAMLKQFSQ